MKNRGFDFGDFEITKREILASISIIAMMLLIGFVISGRISNYILDRNEKYNKAIKIESSDLFGYGMRTNVGYAFVYGDLKAVDTVSYPEINGEYMYIEKIEEHYNMHTRTVTTTDSKGKTHTRTETYWSWDYAGSEEQRCSEIVEAFGGNCRKIFANEYIDDRNRSIGSCRERSNLERWAENEVAIACRREKPDRKDGEWDYGCACYESALKAFGSLCEDGHSGFSIGLTKAILNRLINNKPLLPIEDTDEVWSDISDMSGLKGEECNYQCKRMSSLFKYVYADGTVKYRDVDRYHGVNINCPDAPYHSGLIDTVMDELYPITMPYMPADRAFKIYTEDFLVDPAKGDYDTVGILYVITPSMDKVAINRYFKEAPNGFAEIDEAEYKERKEAAKARMEATDGSK